MKEILERIDSAKHIVVVAHKEPDADSLGSASAFYTYLLQLHKKVSFFCVTKDIDARFAFIPWVDKIRSSFPTSADLVIALDSASMSRVGVEISCDIVNIDHHKSNTKYGRYNIIDEESISTTYLIYRVFKEHKISINKKMATAIYAGLLDDSNAFMDSRVDGTVFATISKLIELGADYKSCNRYIVNYISLAGFRLKAIMYKKMRLLEDANVAFFSLDDEVVKNSAASSQEFGKVLEEALHLPTVKLSVSLREIDNEIKGSIRSEVIDVFAIAKEFGGGGHTTRAGFEIGSSLEEAEIKVLKIIRKYL